MMLIIKHWRKDYMSKHDKNCECEDCCTHDDTECGYCNYCGAYVKDTYEYEPEINPDR